MKTPNKPFFNLTIQQPCEKTEFGFLQRLWHSLSQYSLPVRMKLSLPQAALAYALRVTRATLLAVSNEVSNNTRLFVGLILLLVVSPLSSKAYLLFHTKPIDPEWFHLNYYYLSVNLGSNLMAFFALLGIFFLFPARLKTSYILSAPLGFIFADTLHKFFATSNEEYLRNPGFLYVSLLVGLVLGLLLSMDYLLYKQHHIRRAWGARMVAIANAEGLDPDRQVAMMKSVVKDVQEKHYSIY